MTIDRSDKVSPSSPLSEVESTLSQLKAETDRLDNLCIQLIDSLSSVIRSEDSEERIEPALPPLKASCPLSKSIEEITIVVSGLSNRISTTIGLLEI